VLEDKSLHEAAMFMRVAERFGGREVTERRHLVIPEDIRGWVEKTVAARPHIALYIDAPITERIWPPESFAVVCNYVVEEWGMNVVALSGQAGEHLIRRLRRQCRFPERLQTFSRLTLPELAGVIASSRLLVSNDTGPMHFGPILKIPTIGLFSVGLPEHFRPAGPDDLFIRQNPIDAIAAVDVIRAMETLRAAIPDPGSRC
jgi:heptosyltransferase-2